MRARDENSAEIPETAAVFTRALAGLKRRGSNFLLVGPEPAMEQACERFLGDATAEPRRRLFVRTGGNCPHAYGMANANNAVNVKVIEQATETRSTATVSNSENHVDKTVLDTESLATLGIEISKAIEEFEEEGGPLMSSELRVCFDSLTSLADEHDNETVFRFLHVLTGRIRNVNGMGHFHLPVEMDSTIVRTLLPVFDAAVEVRTTGGNVEQRWHLVRQDVTTEWLTL